MKKKIILSGCFGRMGCEIRKLLFNSDKFEIVAGVDIKSDVCNDFPVYSTFKNVKENADVIIDFSNAANLSNILEYAENTLTPLVLATTGYSTEQIDQIKNLSNKIPVFFSFNMSLGVNLLIDLAKKATAILGENFDIEIVEKHHNQKLDAPSGTAIMLANAIDEVSKNDMQFEFDRHSKRQKRSKNEIGIHSIRGGTIVGEHEVIFAGDDEILTISHSAASRKIFASGAVKAADYISSKKENGIFNMNDLISSL